MMSIDLMEEILESLLIYSDIKIDKDGSWVTGTGLTRGYYKDEYTFVVWNLINLNLK